MESSFFLPTENSKTTGPCLQLTVLEYAIEMTAAWTSKLPQMILIYPYIRASPPLSMQLSLSIHPFVRTKMQCVWKKIFAIINQLRSLSVADGYSNSAQGAQSAQSRAQGGHVRRGDLDDRQVSPPSRRSGHRPARAMHAALGQGDDDHVVAHYGEAALHIDKGCVDRRGEPAAIKDQSP